MTQENARLIVPKRVLVTGANGFIGKTLMTYFRESGIEVVGVDLVGDGEDVHQGDIARPETMAGLLAECDVIVHTAALVSNAMRDEDMWRVNVLATRNLLSAARDHGVRRFVQISSVVAYGNSAAGELDELHPVHADGGSYVLTKLASEHVALAAHAQGGTEVVIIRPGDVYGPGSRPWVIEPLQKIAGNQFMLPGMGGGYFRPVYVDDLIRGIALATQVPAAAGEIFNLSCEGFVTTREYFSYHYQWLGKKGPLCVPTWLAMPIAALFSWVSRLLGKPSEVSPATIGQLDTRCWFNISKAKRVLGWQPELSLEQGMSRTREWAEEQGLI